jgi:hypothetical protein
MGSERKPVWKTCLVVGCSVLLLLGLAVGVFVALNWTTITQTVRETTETVTGLLDVQKAVREHARAREVKVHIDMGGGQSTLRLEVVDPGFLDDVDTSSPEAQAKALELAVIARDALPAGTQHERYRIAFVSKTGIGVTFTRSQTFTFESSELPPP